MAGRLPLERGGGQVDQGVNRFDPILALSQLLAQEKERIVRLWAKRTRAELQGFELPGWDLRPQLTAYLDELARLLKERGDEALRLWPESIRSLGPRRYDQRFDADDLAREFKALSATLFHVYGKRHGSIEPEMAELIVALVGEGQAAAQASYARVLRTEEVRFKEAAVMESILHHVEVGILFVDRDGHVAFATAAVSRLLGMPLRALLGSTASQPLAACLGQVRARRPDGRPFRVSEMPFQQVLKDRVSVQGEVMVIDRHPTGEEVVIEMGATPIWEEGEIAGVIQTMTDRTDTAHKGRELSSAYDEMRRLQGRLLQRTRIQALGQLANGAAHALNNFLNVIRLRVTLLRRDFKVEHLDALDRTVRNIGDLVARLQDFSVSRSEEEIIDVELNEVVTDALELARPELEQAPALVKVILSLESKGRVRVDVAYLRELAVNLLLAARDRMPQGGEVRLSTREADGWLTLEIEDGGRPYTPDELTRLFDPLKGKSKMPQLSLLLAVGRNQVQRWGGELTSAAREAGASFQVRLPVALAKEQPVPLAPPRPEPRLTHQARQVLVVDDDPDNARMLADVLAEEGYQVQVAHSGREALALWESRSFDAALLDALMPDMSGWELAREVRRRSPGVLVAMVTGADVRGQNRNNLAQVDAVFRKPIDVGALDEFLTRGEPPRLEGALSPLHS